MDKKNKKTIRNSKTKKNNKNKNNKKEILTLDKCLEQVDLIDFYITKNILEIIEDKKKMEYIKLNMYLLSVSNKNNKNSLMILLENQKFNTVKELIKVNPSILNYKNVSENNLFKILLGYKELYDTIENIIIDSNRDHVIKILTTKNKDGYDFIDNLIILINTNMQYFYLNKEIDNENTLLIQKIINIAKNIYLLDSEKNTMIVTRLCKTINDEKYLEDILKYFEIDDFDIFPDSDMLVCVDYLIYNDYFNVLEYLLDRINYIEFVNIDNNVIYKLLDSPKIDLELKSNILIKILRKSNISKFKNNRNQNVFYWLVNEYTIDSKVLISFKDLFDLYEQDINGISLFDLVKKKYNSHDINLITNEFSKQLVNKNYFEKICKKINIKKKLVKSDIGIFTANIIHNMLYTINILNDNKDILSIPYFIQSTEYRKNQEEFINISNNEKGILGYIKLFFMNFNNWLPHLIIWKNKYNYWIDTNLLESVKKQSKSIQYIYIKLSVYLIDGTDTRHSNLILIDNINKTIERFEPYGEMIFTNSQDINQMIQSQIANPLGYKFIFVQPYPGFQSRSDEFAKYNKTYGDPMGFCLAWSFLYLDIKMELSKLKSKINPIDFINWYIINKFSKDFNINDKVNKTNKYILFIRFYARYLDLEKNKLIKKFNLDPSLSYQADFDIDYHNTIVTNINSQLEKFIS
jgi:hypothetical protein